MTVDEETDRSGQEQLSAVGVEDVGRPGFSWEAQPDFANLQIPLPLCRKVWQLQQLAEAALEEPG